MQSGADVEIDEGEDGNGKILFDSSSLI